MATHRPTSRYEDGPPVQATHYGQPVTGRTLQSLAVATIGLTAWRGRRGVHVPVSQPPSTGASLLNDLPDAVTQTLRIPWRCSDRAEHVAVGFFYQARADHKSAFATVAARVLDLAGTVIDAGCIWDQEAGTLTPSEAHLDASLAAGFVFTTVPRFVSTGYVVDDVAARPSRPRPLEIDSVNRGAWVYVELVATAVRLWSVDLLELPESEITL